MKEEHLNKLIESAFGELSQADEASLLRELQANPEWEQELASYQAMTADLRLVAHVEECQLSTDRLHDAIFAQPVPAKVINLWQRPVAWGTLAVAACALGAFVLFRPEAGPTKSPIQDVAIQKPSMQPERPVIEQNPSDLIPSVQPEPAPLDSEPEPQPVRTYRVTKKTHRPAQRTNWGGATKSIETPKPDAPVMTKLDAPAAMKSVETSEPVVIIDQAQDSTGTPIATEVKKDNDLVISG